MAQIIKNEVLDFSQEFLPFQSQEIYSVKTDEV
jgi:hypothetical protein